MTIAPLEGFEKPRLKAPLEHFSSIEDPSEPWRVAHPLDEVLLLVVCGMRRRVERAQVSKLPTPSNGDVHCIEFVGWAEL